MGWINETPVIDTDILSCSKVDKYFENVSNVPEISDYSEKFFKYFTAVLDLKLYTHLMDNSCHGRPSF